MFIDDSYEGIYLFQITRIEASKRLADLQSYLNDTKITLHLILLVLKSSECVVHDTVLLKLERLNTNN